MLKRIVVNRKSSLTFDGILAQTLTSGGAYKSLEDYSLAKSIGSGVCRDLFNNRWEDVTIFTPKLEEYLGNDINKMPTYNDISDWFKYIDVWNHCYTVLDKGLRLIHVILITDED